jgi:hypothetical protein
MAGLAALGGAPGLRTVLPEPVWRARALAHRARLEPTLSAQLVRRSRGVRHPVLDFLFEYYTFSPGRLLRWSPGADVGLEGARADEFPAPFVSNPAGAALPSATLPARLRANLERQRRLLLATRARKPHFGCLGLHEWAMVYEAEDIRHPRHPLRLSHAETRRVVEAHPLRCSHYDAFRFFSASARPRNAAHLAADTREAHEQPGCLHANMDLYRFAFKLDPWIPSELIADTWELAARAREVDMRASPYDLADLGYPPIAIETPEGQAEYRAHQRDIAEAAAPLRDRVLAEMDRLLALTSPGDAGTMHPEPSHV